MKILESKITSVTVFIDRAQITRVAKIELPKGENKVAFDKLPTAVEQKSIQVSGTGKAVLSDITFKKVFYNDYPEEQVGVLYNQLDEFKKTRTEIKDSIEVATKEKKFVDNITEKLTSSNGKEKSSPVLDPEQWIKMVDFYRQKNEKLSAELRTLNIKKSDLQKKIDKLNREIVQYGSNKEKTRNQVQVSLDNSEDVEITLELKYITYGASWYPYYDLRASTSIKKMNISYNAMISQRTGEDWDNIAVNISTAQVQISGKQPELTPWYVDVYQPPVTYSPKKKKRSMEMKKERSKISLSAKLDEFNDTDLDDMMPSPPPSIEIKQAKVETGATSVLFNIPGTNTIKSDNTPHKVSITIQELEADFTYGTVPKISQFAYLKTKVTNTTEFPFLPGETNIFLDGSFVANSEIKLVAPNQKFTTSLGVDEAMKVQYKLINKYEKDKGFMSKKTNIVFEYQIIITNNKKTNEKIIIFDQIPISQHDDIKVELNTPKYKEDTDDLKINKQKIIEWHKELDAGEKITIDFIFSVENPQNMRISGI